MSRRPSTATLVLALAAVLVVAVLAVSAWRHLQLRVLPTGAAEWIWHDTRSETPAPAAFYAVRDFRLSERPDRAHLLALADEEYVLYLNGRRVGSNRYEPGAPLDVYPVADLLLVGPNRLVAELRSSRGAGGFLAALEVEDGEGAVSRPVVTDRSWRLVPQHQPGLLEGWLPVAGGAASPETAGEEEPFPRPRSWGRPPTGRWDLPRRGEVRPVAASLESPGIRVCAPSPAQGGVGEPPQRVVFDFGREVTGYLEISRPAGPPVPPRVSLLATGEGPPRPLADPAAAVPVVAVPGSPRWSDVVPRRFRYAAVVGMEGPLEAAVLPVEPDLLEALPGALTGEAATPGLLGLFPRGRRTPAEDAVRRRLMAAEEEEEGDP